MNNKKSIGNVKVDKIVLTLLSILIICLVIFLIWHKTSNNYIPDGMTQETYDIGIQALKIMDKYNDAEIDSGEATKRLGALQNSLENLEYTSDSNITVSLKISSFLFAIGSENSNNSSYDEANKLREMLEVN